METQEEAMTQEEQEIIAYGLAQGKIMLAGWAVTLLLGAVFQVFWESVIFLAGFNLLRIYAGGYHADTQLRCGVFSFAAMCCACIFMRFVRLTGPAAGVTGLILCCLISLLSPVENDRRRLEEEERKEYGQKTRFIAFGECAVLWIGAVLRWETVTSAVLGVYLLVLVLLLLGRIKYGRVLAADEKETVKQDNN